MSPIARVRISENANNQRLNDTQNAASYLQAEFFELPQCLGVALGIIHRIMRVRRYAILLPLGCFGCVLYQTGIEITNPATGEATKACGLNISRWEDGLLAEEWAVWESLAN